MPYFILLILNKLVLLHNYLGPIGLQEHSVAIVMIIRNNLNINILKHFPPNINYVIALPC